MNEYDAIAISVVLLGVMVLVLGISKQPQQIHFRVGKVIIGACCLLWGISYFVEIGLVSSAPTFASEAEFLAAQEHAGYVSIGRFDASWPAIFVEEAMDDDKISFVRQDGTPQEYSGFDGYRLKVVRLRDRAGREPTMVLRSRAKR